MPIQEDVAIKILEAVQKAVCKSKDQSLISKICEGETPLDEFLSAIANLKYLELVILKSCTGIGGLKPDLLRELADDVTKATLIRLIDLEMVTPEELSVYYGAEFLGELVKTSRDFRKGSVADPIPPDVPSIEADVKKTGVMK